MLEDRAQYLLNQYIRNTSTADELAQLADWIKHSDPEEVQRALDRAWEEFEPQATMPSDHAEKMLQDIIALPRAPSRSAAPLIKMTWLKWTAAAAVVLTAGVLSWNYLTGSSKAVTGSEVIAKRTAPGQEIHPGTTSAVLTLSDGSTIALDTASSGAIAFQNNTRIVQKNGQLVYQNTTGSASALLYNRLSTGRGQQYPLTLSDGTKVWLNAEASIKYPVLFGRNERNVEVTGEAYFEVAKDASRPFRVSIGDSKVEVLGTHFNVNAYPDEGGLKTTLLEGSVKMIHKGSSVLLHPGEQAGVQKNGSIKVSNNVDEEEVISWKDGYFHFNDASVSAIMRQISRWYDVDVVYEQRHSEETFDGDIQKSLALSQVLKLLEKSQVHFRVEGKRVIVGK